MFQVLASSRLFYFSKQTTILAYLATADVVALSRTNRSSSQLQPLPKTIAYNIDYHLKRFLSDIVKFRSTQGEAGALIGSRTVRDLFQKITELYKQLDFFCGNSTTGRQKLAKHLLGEGYTQSRDTTFSLCS